MGGGGFGWISEVFVKIQKKNVRGSSRGLSGWMWTKKRSFCGNSKKKFGGGGSG